MGVMRGLIINMLDGILEQQRSSYLTLKKRCRFLVIIFKDGNVDHLVHYFGLELPCLVN